MRYPAGLRQMLQDQPLTLVHVLGRRGVIEKCVGSHRFSQAALAAGAALSGNNLRISASALAFSRSSGTPCPAAKKESGFERRKTSDTIDPTDGVYSDFVNT